MNIRPAIESDLEPLIAILGNEMAPEFEFCSTDWEKGAQEVRNVFVNGQILVIELGAEIAGTVGLIECDHFWWSSDPFVVDRWLFIRPQFRKTRAFFLLMKYLRIVAKYSPAPLMLSISSPQDNELKQRVFGRYGERIGNYYRIQEMR